MDDASFIVGLMKTETAALGFIPAPAIRERWVSLGRYIIQRDRRGRPRGYLLHGPLTPGRPLFINQAIIDYDHRMRGHGILAARELLKRAIHAGCTPIKLRCADDLEANAFWQAAGFKITGAEPGGAQRHRYIVRYELNLLEATTRLRAPVRSVW